LFKINDLSKHTNTLHILFVFVFIASAANGVALRTHKVFVEMSALQALFCQSGTQHIRAARKTLAEALLRGLALAVDGASHYS